MLARDPFTLEYVNKLETEKKLANVEYSFNFESGTAIYLEFHRMIALEWKRG